MTASHSSVLRQRFLEFAKELTAFTCLLQSLRLVDRVRMSSAWDNAPRKRPFRLRPQDFSRNSSRIGSITKRKRTGERTDPCHTPRTVVREGGR